MLLLRDNSDLKQTFLKAGVKRRNLHQILKRIRKYLGCQLSNGVLAWAVKLVLNMGVVSVNLGFSCVLQTGLPKIISVDVFLDVRSDILCSFQRHTI